MEPCIKPTGIAEAPDFSLNLIQEGVSKRYSANRLIFHEIYHNIAIIVIEEEVEEEQLLI